MASPGIHKSLADIEKDLYTPEPFILQLGAFGNVDVMSDYDRLRSRIEIMMFIIFGVVYNKNEAGVYNREDVYGKKEDHKEGKLCSLICYKKHTWPDYSHTKRKKVQKTSKIK